MSSFRSATHLGLVVFSLIVTGQACSSPPAAQPAGAPAPTRLSAGYGNLPMRFEVNQGQSADEVKFLARGQGYSVFLTRAEAVLSLREQPDAPAGPGAVVRMRLVGANAHPQLTGIDPLPGASNYFIGNDPAGWQRDVPSYAKVKSAAVYPGIDLVYYGNQRQLEYDIVVAPGADPGRIAVGFDGVEAIAIDRDGSLVLRTARGDLTQQRPVIYQDIDGQRQIVDGGYVLHAGHRVGFEVDSYDTTRPLIIDPVLSYSTYLGGNNNDIGYAIAVDNGGNAYVTGLTRSTNFPGASSSAIQPVQLGSDDVFVTKINAAGNGLFYTTYLGGSGGDIGFAIAVDSAGNAYVTGETSSPTAAAPGNLPFPTVGAFQSQYHLGGDAFVTKINPAGNALVYSTYLGGSGVERGYGIAVDSAGSAYVTGSTNSVNQVVPSPTDFPVVAPFQAQNGGNGNFDAFVTKFNAAGNGLVYSTFLGGDASEYSLHGGAIAVDSAGNAYVGGSTASLDFPGAKVIQATNGGGVNDGFVVKFNAAGGALVFSTYLGGNLYDAVNGIALDGVRTVYVTGYTDSPNFPIANPLQASRNGTGNDAFISRINEAGDALIYSTYLGGSGSDVGYAIAVDGFGSAFVSGFTNSINFPTAAPLQAAYAGSGDAFISQLASPGHLLMFSTYWGGSSGGEHGHGIAVDGAGDPYVSGETNSSNFPASPGAFQTTLAATTDAFLVKFSMAPTVLGPPAGLVATSIVGNTVTISWTAPANSITPTSYVLEGGLTPGSVLASLPTNSAATSYTFAAPTGAYYIRMHSLAGGARSAASNEIRIFVNSEAAPPSAPVNLQGTVAGSAISLVWTNTAGGGTPTGLVMDVTGSLSLSLGLPVSADFSLARVADGTYTLSLRAVNSAGTSASSNAITLTFPGACPVPQVPTNLSVTRSGSVLTASWGLPASGPAPASYLVLVTGTFNGQLSTSGLSLSGSVGAGSYTISVAGVNSCGTGPATTPQTVTVP